MQITWFHWLISAMALLIVLSKTILYYRQGRLKRNTLLVIFASFLITLAGMIRLWEGELVIAMTSTTIGMMILVIGTGNRKQSSG